MKAIRATKIKIVSDTANLDGVLEKYRQAYNWLSKIVCESKELNSNRLAKSYYAVLREKHGLTSQLACSLCKVVVATYKTAKANGRWRLAKAIRPTIPIVWRRDFNISKGKGVSLWSQPLDLCHKQLPFGGWKDSKLKRVGKTWFLILCYEVEIPEPKSTGCLVGVDFGVKRLMTATSSANSKTFFFHGGRLNHLRCCIRRRRGAIQAVGSRSAHRLLSRLASREAAVTEQLLHVASKALVKYAVAVGASRIVLEDLSNIRDSSLKKGKELRAKINRWPYAKGQFFIAYKAAAEGIKTECVSPTNTSRGCPRCGYVSASNRHGLRFQCQKCGHRADADRNASENIRLRSVAIEHNSTVTGSCNPPQSSESSDILAGSCDSFGDLVSV